MPYQNTMCDLSLWYTADAKPNTILRTIPTATDNGEDARQRQRADVLKWKYIYKLDKIGR